MIPLGSVLVATEKIVSTTEIEPLARMVSESLACTLTVTGAAGCALGVPEMMPLPLLSVLMVRPAGSPPPVPSSQLPLISGMHQLYGGVPPEAENIAVYGTPTEPAGRWLVPAAQESQVTSSAPSTLMVRFLVAVWLAPSVTWAVKL